MSIEIKLPDIGIDEVEITEIMVNVGDKVKTEQSIITVEGDKASIEIPAPCSGTVQEICMKPGDKVKTGSLIMVLTVDCITSTSSTPIMNATLSSIPITQQSMKVFSSTNHIDQKDEFSENADYAHATPLIRRLAREFGINLTKVKGSGSKGRILREDIHAYVKNIMQHADTSFFSAIPSVQPWPKVDFSKFGAIEEVDISRIQKISGANLSRNWVIVPHVTIFDKTDITDLEIFRKEQNEDAVKRKLDVKSTTLVFIMKAVSAALEKMPRFNSSLSADGKKLILKKYINIGVAVDTPNGLVVPVIKDINKKGIISLSLELMDIVKKARNGKLTVEEIQGGCFTISTLGSIGTTYFSPIINVPEVAILGISRSAMEPIWNGKEFIPRLMMPMSISFDHRVIDGADGARFITMINNILADIRCLIMS